MPFISWRKIRGLGELQILTKASYIMIIIVPVLVAFWPGVKYTVTIYNTKVSGSLSKFEKIISEKEEAQKNCTIQTPNFSYVLSLSFFASLFVILAHAIYGMFIPEIVRKYSITDFAYLKKEEFSKRPSEGMLRTARFYCDMASKNKDIELAYTEYPSMKNNGEDNFRKNLDVINTGSYAQYLLVDFRYLPARIIAALLYLFGLALLLAIIAKQSADIATASGWIS